MNFKWFLTTTESFQGSRLNNRVKVPNLDTVNFDAVH